MELVSHNGYGNEYGNMNLDGDGRGYGNEYGNGYSDGDGYGDGYGYGNMNLGGDGEGYGNEYGNMNLDGDGRGYGNEYGNGYSDGGGYGYGDEYGDGYNNGDGYGDGEGYGNGSEDEDGAGSSDKLFAVDIEYNQEKLIKWYLKEQNAEVRAKIIRKIGLEKLIEKINAKKIDEVDMQVGGHYELYKCVLFEQTRKFLKMINPSTGIVHCEWVPPKIETVKKALKWRDYGYLPDKIS